MNKDIKQIVSYAKTFDLPYIVYIFVLLIPAKSWKSIYIIQQLGCQARYVKTTFLLFSIQIGLHNCTISTPKFITPTFAITWLTQQTYRDVHFPLHIMYCFDIDCSFPLRQKIFRLPKMQNSNAVNSIAALFSSHRFNVIS